MLRDADKLLAPAVERTLGELHLGTVDDTVATLAQQYASTIDAAAELASYAGAILGALDPDDSTGRQHVAMLAAKVGHQAVLSDLGPKLLAALQQLQATPAARSKAKTGGGASAGQSRLQQLRAARR